MAEKPSTPVPPDDDRDEPVEGFVPFRVLARKLVDETRRKYLHHAVTPKSVKH